MAGEQPRHADELRASAFLSYTHADDATSGGKITGLRPELSDAVAMLTGRDFPIFLDADIKIGQQWQDVIDGTLYEVMFLIALVTPRYFNSDACRREMRLFADHQTSLGRADLILPIYMVDCPQMQDPHCPDEMVSVIRSVQYVDWRGQWFAELASPLTKQWTFNLAEQIRAAIVRTCDPATVRAAAESGSGTTKPRAPADSRSVLAAPVEEDRNHAQAGGRQEARNGRPVAVRPPDTIPDRSAPDPEEADQLVEAVHEALVQGRVTEARRSYRRLQRADPHRAHELTEVLAKPCREPDETKVPAGPYFLGLTLEQARAIVENMARRPYAIDLKSRRARAKLAELLMSDGRRQEGCPAFWMDRCLVTNDQFARFVVCTGHETELQRLRKESWPDKITSTQMMRHPVVLVTIADAQAYAQWAGRRLPTEAEWDRAAHGPAGLAYPWGNLYEPRNCNGLDNLPGYETCPVDMFAATPSPYGIVDLVGNVDELTSTEVDALHVAVGGSWRMACEIYGLSGSRRLVPPRLSTEETGFRTARDSG